MPKELLYPCFLSCVEYTDDEYWKSIFEDLSFGITPQGTYISKNYLISNVKNKEFVYKIQKDMYTETLFLEIYALFSEKLDLKSTNEIEEYKNSIETFEMAFNSWNSIKKKSIKDSIIMNYVNTKSSEYDFTTHTSKRLLNTINLSIMLKFITIKNIDYRDSIIHAIDGFTFSKNNFKFERNADASAPTPSTGGIEYNKYQVSLVDIWNKMVDVLSKTIYNKLLF
jgi:hypothetical protein